MSGLAAIRGRKVALGADHGGFPLKEALKAWLAGLGAQIVDVGTSSTEPCDYPVFARKAAEAVASGAAWRAIVVDGAGIGSCMAANKVPGVRAAMAFNPATAKNAREHNDAHVLTLGSGYLDEAAAKAIVDVFLTTDCTVERHQKRVAMIEPRIGGGMATQDDSAALVEQIVRVLTANPQLLAGLGGVAAGAPGNVCTTCNPCTKHCATQAPDAVRTMLANVPGARVSGRLGASAPPRDIAKMIDHTLLRADATYAEVDQLCGEARKYGFASVCVNPSYVRRCVAALKGSEVAVCTVIGFPLGATPRENKAMEARRALRDGAREIDMVLAIGALKSGDADAVYQDIAAVREAVAESKAILKVILETALLTDDEKVTACKLAKKARADFVKTSTGFSKSGATAHDVALMANAVDHQLGVKASGGVKNAADVRTMIAAGATRIGASVGVQIVTDATGGAAKGGGY